jgi:hypothetical protein
VFYFLGLPRRVVRGKSTDVSEEHVAFIFMVEEYAKQETSVNQMASIAAPKRWFTFN